MSGETPKTEAIVTLMSLRDLTQRTGVLYELQVVQLKHWPYVLFDISDNEILPDDRKRVLVFNLTFKYKKKPRNFNGLAKTLEAWCWEILGKEWAVKIRDATKQLLVYEGARGAAWTAPPVDGPDRELTFEEYESDAAVDNERDEGRSTKLREVAAKPGKSPRVRAPKRPR